MSGRIWPGPHLAQHNNPADAVMAAAHELGIEPAAALKLAALAG
ncbi:hypothetical protein [Nonomuraea sp. NPDC048901]